MSNKFESGAYAERLKEARVLLAHSSLVSVIMNSMQKDDVTAWPIICGPMLDYIKSKLGLNTKEDFANRLWLFWLNYFTVSEANSNGPCIPHFHEMIRKNMFGNMSGLVVMDTSNDFRNLNAQRARSAA